MKIRHIAAAAVFLSAPALRAAETPRVFRAGAATSNITPDLGCSINGGFQDGKAVFIHDELHARCLILDDGTTKLALVVADSCVIQRSIFDEAKRMVSEAAGLPMENMLMSATHAHSCGTLTPVGQSEPDPMYERFVARRIADGVLRALNSLEPARIAWGQGSVPQHVFNRRWHLKPGTVPLAVAGEELTLALRLPTPEEVEKAREVMVQSKLYPRMETLDQVYARETVLLADFPPQVSAPLQVLKIGELRVSAIPAEVFVEIGLDLKARHTPTFTVSLANAYHGYLPTPEHHRLGGYETWRARSSCLEAEASTKIVAGLDELFGRLANQGR